MSFIPKTQGVGATHDAHPRTRVFIPYAWRRNEARIVRRQFNKNQIIGGEIMHLAEKKFIPFFENYFFDFRPPGDCQLPDPGGKLGRPNVRPAFPFPAVQSCNRFRIDCNAVYIAVFGANTFFLSTI